MTTCTQLAHSGVGLFHRWTASRVITPRAGGHPSQRSLQDQSHRSHGDGSVWEAATAMSLSERLSALLATFLERLEIPHLDWEHHRHGDLYTNPS